MKIAILSGGFPPDFDAIGDYTWCVSQELERMGCEVSVYTSEGPPRTPPQGVSVTNIFTPSDRKSILNLYQALEKSRPDWLIVQFNPFSFGAWGFNPWLLKVLRQIKKRLGVRIAVMFHETVVPLWPWKFTVMRTWQYPQLMALCRLAEVAFVSTTRWTKEIRWAGPKLVCHHLPVGSNLPLCELTKQEAKAKLGLDPNALAIGIFGSAHVSRLMDWMGDSAQAIHRAIPDSGVLYVGKDGATFRSLCEGVPFDDRGPLPSEEASLCLRAMDLLLSPFSDGISTRRGSAIAGLQHQVALCTTRRDWTDELFSEFPKEVLRLSPVDNKSAFVQDAVELAQHIKEHPEAAQVLGDYYERIFSWPVVARRSVEILQAA